MFGPKLFFDCLYELFTYVSLDAMIFKVLIYTPFFSIFHSV
jgi:hypothetical protein